MMHKTVLKPQHEAYLRCRLLRALVVEQVDGMEQPEKLAR